MYTTNLRKVGGSVMLAVPPAVLDLLHLKAGDAVALAIDDAKLVIEAKSRPYYTLDELLDQCIPSDEPLSEEDRLWANLPPVGREL
jgi:antitoxin ChpS